MPLTRRVARLLGLESASGVMVASVEAGSPAERAGVRERDVIVSFDGRPVTSVDALHRVLTEGHIGSGVELGVLRPTERTTLTVVPEESPRRPE